MPKTIKSVTLRDGTVVRHRGRWDNDITPVIPFIQRLADVPNPSYTDDYIRGLVNPGDASAYNLWSWITQQLWSQELYTDAYEAYQVALSLAPEIKSEYKMFRSEMRSIGVPLPGKAKPKSAAPYNFDVYRSSMIKSVDRALRQKTMQTCRSVWLLYPQTGLWPERCIVVGEDGDSLREVDLSPSRANCSIPDTVDETPDIKEVLEQRFPKAKGQFDLGSALTLGWWLLNGSRQRACEEIEQQLERNGFPLGPRFFVVIAEDDDYEPERRTLTDAPLEAAVREVRKILKKTCRKADAAELARSLYRGRAEREGFIGLLS